MNIMLNIYNLRRKWCTIEYCIYFCSTLIETGLSNSIFFEFEERIAHEFIITSCTRKKHHRFKVAIIWNRGTFSSWIMFATLHELIQFPTELIKCTLILSLTRTSFEAHSRLIRCIRIHLKVACLDSIFLSIRKINNRPIQF